MKLQALSTIVLAATAWLTVTPAHAAAPNAASPPSELAAKLASFDGPLPITLTARPTRARESVQAAPQTFQFLVGGDPLTLLLRPHSVRGASFQVKKQIAGGSYVAHPTPAAATLRGVVAEIPGAIVAASDLPEGVTAFIIVPNGDDLFITPPAGLQSVTSAVHVLSRATEDETFESAHLTLENEALRTQKLSIVSGADNCAQDGFCVADVAVDTDFLMFNSEGSEDRVVAIAEGLINMANLRYEDQLDVRHRLQAVVVRTSASDDPYDPSFPCGTPQNPCGPLSRLSLQWNGAGQFPGIERDTVHLFTTHHPLHLGGESTGDVCGGRGYSQPHGLTVPGLGLTIHELGHRWGSDHQCGIMSNGNSNALDPFCNASLIPMVAKRDLLDGICFDLAIPDDLIFADAFESGTSSEWTAIEDDGGRLLVTDQGAVILGTYSLQADLTGPQPIWLRDDWPNDETRYRARFYIDASGLIMDQPAGLVAGPPDPIVIFAAATSSGTDRLTIELRQGTGIVPYEIRTVVREDNGSSATTTWTGVAVAGHSPFSIEIDWQAATAPGANDGTLAQWIDGQSVATVTGIDNDLAAIDSARLGAVTAIDHPSTRGVLVFDAFESRREDAIGPAGSLSLGSSAPATQLPKPMFPDDKALVLICEAQCSPALASCLSDCQAQGGCAACFSAYNSCMNHCLCGGGCNF